MARGHPGGLLRPVVIGGLLVAVATFACPTSARADWLDGERRVSADATVEQHPQLSGQRLVYSAGASGEDVRVRDLRTDEERLLTPDHTATGRAAISGTRVVWAEADGVHYADLSSRADPELLLAGAVEPAISATRVCYTAAGRIHLRNLRTGADRAVSPATATARSCDLSGDVVVWADDRSGTSQVFALDLSTDTETTVTTASATPAAPRIDHGLVVWQDGDGVYALDLATEQRTTIATGAGPDSNPDVEGGRVVWSDARDGRGNTEIYLYDLTSAVEVRVTRDDARSASPTIAGDRVVYSDNREGLPQLYQRTITPPRLTAGFGEIDEEGTHGVTGRISGAGGVPLVGVTLVLESATDAGAWTATGTVVTAGDGSFDLALPRDGGDSEGSGSTRLRVRFDGSPDFAPTSSRELLVPA